MSLAKEILDHHFSLKPIGDLPHGVQWILPYEKSETRRVMTTFFNKYFNDNQKRFMLFGINPGRFGAGITGIPFTDPVRLEEDCGVSNSFKKRQELSSLFIYEMIKALGGVEKFYSKFYITSLCPLGFIKDNKNYNFYDHKDLQSEVMPMILSNIERHISMGGATSAAFSIGKGKNFKVFNQINKEFNYFEKIIPLPHPRWVMQYKLKSKQVHIDEYVRKLTDCKSSIQE